jgi:hypothetical protein
MAIDASAVLGQPQLAAAKVNPIGTTMQRSSIQGGLLGALVGKMMAGKSPVKGDNQMPRFGSLGIIAVTEYELALITVSGLGAKPKDVLVRVPLSEVSSAELRKGYVGQLAITFSNGVHWYMEVSPPMKKGAKAVVAALQQRIGAAASAA